MAYVGSQNVVDAFGYKGRKITYEELVVRARGPVVRQLQAVFLLDRYLETGEELAEEGLFYASSQGSGHIPAIKCEVVDATGAGDALTAGVVFGLVNNLPLDECMRLGVSAATLTLSSPETVCPEMSQELLFQRMVI